MTFHVLGPLEAHTTTGAVVELGAREAGTVPAVLLLHPNAPGRTDELVRATWPEHAVPAAAEANLKTSVSELRVRRGEVDAAAELPHVAATSPGGGGSL